VVVDEEEEGPDAFAEACRESLGRRCEGEIGMLIRLDDWFAVVCEASVKEREKKKERERENHATPCHVGIHSLLHILHAATEIPPASSPEQYNQGSILSLLLLASLSTGQGGKQRTQLQISTRVQSRMRLHLVRVRRLRTPLLEYVQVPPSCCFSLPRLACGKASVR
jgi:hypothetical protein